jgi:hypothetical protein
MATTKKRSAAKPKLPKYVFWDKYGEGGTIQNDADLKKFLSEDDPYYYSSGEEDDETYIAEIINVRRFTVKTVTTRELEEI